MFDMSNKSFDENKDSSAINDSSLVVEARNGDIVAMEKILEKYKPMVRRKASRYYIHGCDSEDIIQEGMIGLFKAIRKYDVDKNVPFSSFAVYCVISQITDAIRKANILRDKAMTNTISLTYVNFDEDDDYDLLEAYIDLSRNNPEFQLISKEEADSLKKFMENDLTDNERNVLELFIEGYQYQEIADKLNRSKKSVDSAIQRARAKFEIFIKELDE